MVSYFFEDTGFKFNARRLTGRWIKSTVGNELKKLGDVNIIFCSDNYILEVNRKYLQHDYFTDIITFDYCEGDVISGDLFISVDTVRDNSVFYGTEFEAELNRVIIHGILHLAGYDDRTEDEQKNMRSKEDYYLAQRIQSV